MGRIKNTWELAKISWRVITHDRELLWIPVLSFLAAAAVLVVIAIPAIAIADTSSSTTTASGEESVDPLLAVLGIVAAVALGVISVFFNGALVAGAHQRFSGGDPTVRSSIGRAFSRISGLVPWALLTVTVGMVLQALRERSGMLGRFVVNLIGTAWDVATFLVVPAIVIDDMGAVDGLKRSGSLLKQTWGENIAARVGFGLLGFAAIVPVVVLVAIGAALGSVALVATIIVAVVWVAIVVVVMTALNAVFQTALYLYATTGTLPAGFEGADLRATFGPR